MSTNHTPGPWVFYADTPSTDPNWHIVTTANRMRVLANVHIEPGNEMDLANARLITAAPELLYALWGMVTSFHAVEYMEPHMQESAKRARAAIGRATGEQP